MEWSKLFFSTEIQTKLSRLLARRFTDSTLAEEAYNFVLEHISQDNWARLRQFKGQANHKTFMHSVFSHLLEDFSRHKFGRPRPPAWLKRLGPLWLRLYQLLCLEREDTEQAVFVLTQYHVRDAAFVRAAADTVKGRIADCGQTTGSTPFTPDMVDTLQDKNSEHQTDTPEDLLSQKQQHPIMAALRMLLGSPPEQTDPQHTCTKPKQKHRLNIQLDDEDRLILKMRFQDALKRSVVAKRLGYTESQIRTREHRALTTIQQELAKADIDSSDIHALSNF
ncbi:sigma factor-like helix-turn-helix DNA-binding protein [Magnetococcus sp. PR-3]|uniref:sigma factor-like helix-turn-helix DNA-binding protein n=1 Tax=Magnetococcus sp. PR-3 TaxID=3120355 RepID=UPI002FCE14CF